MYDDDGRLVHSVTTREVEWDDDERAKVLALLDYEAQTCPGCGGFLPETTDPQMQFRYEADNPSRCHRCDALHAKQEAYKDQTRSSALVIWPVEPRE